MLANISTRGSVGTGDDVLIGGFILQPDGGASSTILVRAIGPSLAAAQVAGPLEDPEIELYDSNGASIAFNDNWKETQQTDIEAASSRPPTTGSPRSSQPLAPGAYTAIVRGAAAAPESAWWKFTGCLRSGKIQRASWEILLPPRRPGLAASVRWELCAVRLFDHSVNGEAARVMADGSHRSTRAS